MCSMQELSFWLDKLRWNSLCSQCFHFCYQKEHNFKKKKNENERQKKTNLSELTQILCDLLSLLSKYFQVKI